MVRFLVFGFSSHGQVLEKVCFPNPIYHYYETTGVGEWLGGWLLVSCPMAEEKSTEPVNG